MKNQKRCCYGGVCALVAAMLAGCGPSEQPAAAPATPVAAMTVAATRVDVTEDLPGRVAAVRVAEIRPQVSGIVQRRLFEQGTEVRVGQPLFQINPAPFKAEMDTAAASLQRAQAALERAKVQTARFKPLVEADAISGQVYDDAVSQRDQAAADVAQARATLARRQLDLKFATVEAPIAGRIDQALVTEGALVSSSDSQPMARIQQIDQVYVDVRQPAASLDALRGALAAQPQASDSNGLPVDVLRDDDTRYDVKGRMLFSGVNVDPGTGDVLLRVLVDNPKRQLLPGMYVRARIPRAHYANAVMVPQQAIVRAGGKPQVWVLDAKGTAHLKAVEVGELTNRSYRIKSGLQAGQRIVVEGMERLTDGAPAAATDWKSPDAAAIASAH
ncbi:efflux RND transporter periplasmic adaptor subunit [Burkholderia cenocepacia]|jgi:multidrug efflux system membrane fusion protein|uniref:efflux RND transporter periplasmic adaptor subunit n=1 Tax=Burkholderia cenocepacia TaxID=95486 RepID=UPI0004F7AEC3|nr:efflux RND transporter periplasmic adaptor subunit [Burkholderia cenocepacia]AIO45635.1 efflux transporter, RND family, MFP subunit [Burkholderia cepacia]KGC02294.1 efflux transporter, RND family, MFP subunit [Burkholderia cepacia]MCG0579584.1 efflux RND transporter periplasmic adaptor subunit [Burkholderia cenocepacia]MCW3523797.1 efflux RND transporter periplasmic adaptor subunit [Burkholderia cenocepacia]MCW3611927.1 efflux RND transporter periplasmic adaptor subunit [Burkholderia cenoce